MGYYLFIGVSIVTGIIVGWFTNAKISASKIGTVEERTKKLLADCEKEATAIKLQKSNETKQEWHKKKHEFDLDINQKKQKQQTFEKQLSGKEENLERRAELLNKKERELQTSTNEIEEKRKTIQLKIEDIHKLVEEENIRLERASGMSRDDAKKLLMQNLTEEAKTDAAQTLKEIRDNLKEEAKREAQKIIIQAIQRTASDHAIETTVSVLHLEGDEMKGRIIGKEGRNIRALEAATGVDVIVDDTPEAVILSGFDSFRREIARVSLERLIADGRIHPQRIEEVVAKVEKELLEEAMRLGENTFVEVGLGGGHKEILKHIGKMKFRTSYGQNLLHHSIEVAHLCGIMAAELGIDITLAKRAGLLHDIGKTLDKSIEGPHALIGMDFAKKYGEHAIVLNGIGAHHDDIPMEHAISSLVQAADSISGSRPGARRESVEGYAKRLEKLETLASSFNGVSKVYAIQAGREIRVIVEHDKVDDAMADQLAFDIAKKIQQDLEYPGQIRVVVIREKRAIAIAK